MAKLYTGDMHEREILENFVLSQKAGETHYLYSEITTYIGSGEVNRNNIEDKRKQMRIELHIWWID